ncbi:MAG: TrkA family potassium uptake protein [Halopenitus sp.]
MSTNKRIVVAGGGRIGAQSARLLHDRGHTVVLIEREAERSEALGDERIATVISGDATHPSVLEQADLETADAIATLTADPGTNLAICLLARDINPDIFTLARTDAAGQREYTEYVDSVVLTQQCVATRAVDLIVGGEVRTFTGADGGFELVDLVVREGSSVEGCTLEEVSLPEGCQVVGGSTTGRLASPELTFEPGDRYLLAVEPETLEDVRMLFQE